MNNHPIGVFIPIRCNKSEFNNIKPDIQIDDNVKSDNFLNNLLFSWLIKLFISILRDKMAVRKKLGSVKRFGSRYGRTVRHKVASIEAEQRKLHKCPYCHFDRVKRQSVGIWQCRKCNAKFAGKAYTIGKTTKVTEEPNNSAALNP